MTHAKRYPAEKGSAGKEKHPASAGISAALGPNPKVQHSGKSLMHYLSAKRYISGLADEPCCSQSGEPRRH
jgi:hypothetical protein